MKFNVSFILFLILPPKSPKRGTFGPASQNRMLIKVGMLRTFSAKLPSLLWGRVEDGEIFEILQTKYPL